MHDVSLAGIGVLVTRPAHQYAELVASIEGSGGRAVVFPVIEIRPRSNDVIAADAAGLAEPDITIFVSRNAVEHGLPWAAGLVAAVGPATAAAIESAGRVVDICPAQGYDSESLLAEPLLENVVGKTVRIIRGRGGRELLGDTLRQRGATVDYLEVYSREIPYHGPAEIGQLLASWTGGDIDAVVIMSVESLRNLVALLPEPGRTLLAKTPLVTPAARVIKEAIDRLPGCPTILAPGPGADELVRAVATLGPDEAGQHS